MQTTTRRSGLEQRLEIRRRRRDANDPDTCIWLDPLQSCHERVQGVREHVEQLGDSRSVWRIGTQGWRLEQKFTLSANERSESGRPVHQGVIHGVTEQLVSCAYKAFPRCREHEERLRVCERLHKRLLDVDMRTRKQSLSGNFGVGAGSGADVHYIGARTRKHGVE